MAVGFIALAGVAAETGVIMLIYLDHAMKEFQTERAAEGKEFQGIWVAPANPMRPLRLSQTRMRQARPTDRKQRNERKRANRHRLREFHEFSAPLAVTKSAKPAN
jgi:hypothetical protein